jgi:effector-binding domain-containing protein
MPLERIAKVLDAPEADRAVEIRRYWIELEGSMAVRLRLVEYLNSFLEGRGDTMYEVRTRHIPEQQVLTVKRSVRQPELLPILMEAMPGVAVALDKTGVHHATRTFVIYHGAVNADSDGPVEVCMAFDGTIQAPDGFAVRTEPAHEEAYVTISERQMEFPKFLDAYDTVSGYVNEHGELAGAPREVYFVDVNAVGPDDPFADAAKPMTAVRQPAAS